VEAIHVDIFIVMQLVLDDDVEVLNCAGSDTTQLVINEDKQLLDTGSQHNSSENVSTQLISCQLYNKIMQLELLNLHLII